MTRFVDRTTNIIPKHVLAFLSQLLGSNPDCAALTVKEVLKHSERLPPLAQDLVESFQRAQQASAQAQRLQTKDQRASLMTLANIGADLYATEKSWPRLFSQCGEFKTAMASVRGAWPKVLDEHHKQVRSSIAIADEFLTKYDGIMACIDAWDFASKQFIYQKTSETDELLAKKSSWLATKV